MTPTSTTEVIGPSFGRLTGKEAWSQNLRLTSLVASKVRTCLGPKGSYKMVTYNRGPELVIKVTKDGNEITDEIAVKFPVAKIIAEAIKIHRDQFGDGVSCLLILLSSLLSEAEKLRAKDVHPNVILRSYNLAAGRAIQTMERIADASPKIDNNALLDLVDCGRGLLTEPIKGKILEAVRRASKDDRIDTKRIRIIKKDGGTTDESQLVNGLVVKRKKAHDSMPSSLNKLNIALISGRLDIKPLDIKMPGQGHFPLSLQISSPEQISRFRSAEQKLKMQMVEKIKSVGANVVLSSSPIALSILDKLSREGIFAVMSIEEEDMEAIMEATGAKIVSEVEELTEADLGHADKIEEGRIHLEDVITITNSYGITTLLLRSSSPEKLAELERIVRNAILVIRHASRDGRTVPGGGAIQMQVATELREFALEFPDKEQLVIVSFANSLEEIPKCLAQNFGLNPLDTLVDLRHGHACGQCAIGVSERGCVDMNEENLRELFILDKAVIERTVEVASLMLQIDDFIFAKDLPLVHKK